MTLTILQESANLIKVIDENGNEFWTLRERLNQKSPITKRVSPPRRILAAEISDILVTYLQKTGVDIRVMAAPEHKEELERMLRKVNSCLPESFECVAVGENGGLTRPWAPGFVCTFKKPPEGMTLLRFHDEGSGIVSTASTPFALGLIKRGFPITAWKGKK
jgi:hypothetical protein